VTRAFACSGLARLFPALVFLAGCASQALPGQPRGWEVVRQFPHDTSAYTQGLVYADGILYESTGLYGHSTLRRVELATGRVLDRVALPDDRFGEGLALRDGRLYQLTWMSEVAYVYDTAGLALLDSLAYRGEGWGLTSAPDGFIMSNGSDTLQVRDPATFVVTRTVPVRFASGAPVGQLNELEYVNGELFANVYQSDWILRIDPETGRVTDVLDLAGILPGWDPGPNRENVLNGIAVDRATGHLFVTGKRWPVLFELRLSRPPGSR
jgi:glutamine cyclotransferase